jgi:hypothetical protein
MVAWSCITKSTMKGTLCESPPTASFILPIFLHEHRWRSNGLALVGAVGRGVPRARATLFLPTSSGRGGLGSSGSTSAHATPPSGVRPITSISPQCRASPFGMTETLRVTLLDAQKLVRDVDVQVAPLAGGAKETLTIAKDTLAAARSTLGQGQKSLATLTEAAIPVLKQADKTFTGTAALTGSDSAVLNDLSRTLRSLDEAARAIRALASTLERNPEMLIRGRSK